MTDSHLTIKRLERSAASFEQDLAQLLAFDEQHNNDVWTTVSEIVQAVRTEGDAAVLAYTQKFDNANLASIEDVVVTSQQMQDALQSIPSEVRVALEKAAERIFAFHTLQKQENWQITEDNGTVLGQQVTAMERVGVYVPGGKAVYPSSVLMNTIPAKVAGVDEIVMVVPAPNGELNPMVLAAAAIAGVDKVYSIGGAQAIAALAYGTQTIPAVDKIVGPGNIFVATAKRMVFGTVGIDMIAGPSEILVVCDGSTPADWIAMDLFSQAEHDEEAQAILISPSADFLTAVETSINALLAEQPRAEIIKQSLLNRGGFILVKDLDEAIALVNDIAPEHLELSFEGAESRVKDIRHAGAIFVGKYTAEAFGDYCAGPNHVLPTARTARFSSPLGVYDFQKRSSIIQLSAQGANELAPIVMVLAEGEQLSAHAQSAAYRQSSTDA